MYIKILLFVFIFTIIGINYKDYYLDDEYQITEDDIHNNLEDALYIIKKQCYFKRNPQYKINMVNDEEYLMLVSIDTHIQNYTTYPSLLFNNYGFNDFELTINLNYNWALTEKELKNSNYHMTSVLMHELLHVMGFYSNMNLLYKGYDILQGIAPTIYDKQITHNDKLLLSQLNESFYGKEIYIGDTRLYNPIEYTGGSSITHIHNTKSLMSHGMTSNIKYDYLDNNIIDILNKIGWDCNYTDVNIDIDVDIDVDDDNVENALNDFSSLMSLIVALLCILAIVSCLCGVIYLFCKNLYVSL